MSLVVRIHLDWDSQISVGFSVLADAASPATCHHRHLRTLRNPIYMASPLLLIGLSLVFAKWWPMLLLVAVIPLQIGRARREASVLRAAFGAEYDRYRAKTWF